MNRQLMRLARSAVVVAGCAGCSGAPAPQAPTPVVSQSHAAVRFDVNELRADLYAIAADSFHGRESGTPDGRRAAMFLAARAQAMGLEPAGDSGFLQRVPLVSERFTAGTRFSVSDSAGATSLELGRDMVPMLGNPAEEGTRAVAGEIVFLGYGATPGSHGATDSSLARLVRGRIAVVVHGAPAGADSASRVRLESEESLAGRLAWASSLEPAAVIVVIPAARSAFYDALTAELLRPVVPATPIATNAAGRRAPAVFLALAAPGSPLLPDDWQGFNDARLLGRRFAGRVELSRRPFTGYNVVAMVRGSDPARRHTYVAYGAHYDGVGIVHPRAGERASRDTIANGADDDASGTVALLAIARRLARERPARSVLFVWHGAEEKGMLGSQYFTTHPTVPLDSIVAEINADMIGRNAPRQLFVVGPRSAPNGSSVALGAIVDSVDKRQSEPFEIDRSADVADGDRAFERSDQFNYALRGIPVVLFTTGPHADYHGVGDDARKIDYEKLARVARLMFDVGVAVANRSTRPE